MILAYVFLHFWAIGRSELTFSNIFGPSDALAAHLCSEIVQGRVRIHPLPWYFEGFGPWAGNLKGGVTGTFIADTVYLLLDT